MKIKTIFILQFLLLFFKAYSHDFNFGFSENFKNHRIVNQGYREKNSNIKRLVKGPSGELDSVFQTGRARPATGHCLQ